MQQVLRVLTKTEWKAFADFVASPYFNKNDKFVRFYKLLQPYFPHFELTEKEKEKIYIIPQNQIVTTMQDIGICVLIFWHY